MVTLLDYYNARKSALQQRLLHADSLPAAVALLQDETRRLASLDGEYLAGLGVPQARLAQAMLETLSIAVGALNAVDWQQSVAAPATVDSTPLPRLAQSVGAGVVTGTVVGMVIGGPLGAAFGAGVGSAVGGGLQHYGAHPGGQQPSTRLPIQSKIDAPALLTQFEQALAVVEQAVNAQAAPVINAPKPPHLVDHPEVLRLLQQLLAAEDRTPLAPALHAQLDAIPHLLHQYGITLRTYTAMANADEAAAYFDFEPSIDPKLDHCVSLTPALLKGDEVLLRGRVIEPMH